MKKLLLLPVLFSFSVAAFAQQDALYSQYMFNMMLINPGYTGSRDVTSVTALYRKQWVNMPGAPETMTFSADMPLKNEKMGIGVIAYNDKIGVINNTGFYGNYSYRVRLTNNSTLAMGASFGVTNYQANYASVKVNEAGIATDPAFTQNISRLLPNAGVGLYWSSDKFYVGFSMPHVFDDKLIKNPLFSAREYRHVYLMGGYVFDLSHHVKLKPSTLIKEVAGAPIQVDLNAQIWLYDKYSFGISYRSFTAPVFLVEIQLFEQLRFGYAYDYTMNKMRYYNNGTHEFLLRYEFGYDKGKMITPRYF